MGGGRAAGSFHGFTGTAVGATYTVGRRGFGPPVPGNFAIPAPNAYHCPVRHCRDACDLTCLETGFSLLDAQSAGALAACVAEPILSTGGVVVPPPGYFPRLKALCEARGMLLVLDEAQTAFGRVGANFAFEQDGAVPDLLALSKTLGGGLPLAATVTTDAIEAACHDAHFVHVTSHVSDPLPAAVGLRRARGTRARAPRRAGRRDGQAARGGPARAPGPLRRRRRRPGRGLLWGVELVRDRASRQPDAELGARVTQRCLELGLSMNITSLPRLASVWRIAPPLTVSEGELDEGLAILDQALREGLAAR